MPCVGTAQDPLHPVKLSVNTAPAADKGDDNEKGRCSALQAGGRQARGRVAERRVGGTSGGTAQLRPAKAASLGLEGVRKPPSSGRVQWRHAGL